MNGCLKHFLAENPCEKAASAKGWAEKEEWHELLLVHQARWKNQKAQQATGKEFNHKYQKKRKLNWWSEEKMVIELGPHKTAHWIESLKLPDRGDRLTGCRDRYKIEFGCPEDIEEITDEELRTLKIETENEVDEEDMKRFGHIFAVRNHASGLTSTSAGEVDLAEAAASVEVKKEKLNPSEELALKCESLMMNVKETIQRFQTMELNMRVVESAAKAEAAKRKNNSEDDLEEQFREKVTMHLKHLSITIRILTRLLDEEADTALVPNIIGKMEKADTKEIELRRWSIKFGYVKDVSTKKKRGRDDE